MHQGTRKHMNHLGRQTIGEVIATPGELKERFPISEEALIQRKVSVGEVADILSGEDTRMLAIIGPCSMDSSLLDDGWPAVVRYAEHLKEFSEIPEIEDNLKIVMRAPVSKPRTALGWAGLSQTNPELAFDLTTRIVNAGMPLAMELLSRDDADYYDSLLTLGWIGARNVEDTTIRHVASDLEIPVLFKNSTNGSLVGAENAIETAAGKNIVKRMRDDGRLVNRESSGNVNTGIIFRGGNVTSPEEFAQQFVRLRSHDRPIVVDCSHGNGQAFGEGEKTAESQLACSKALRMLMKSGSFRPVGIMLESYLLSGSDSKGQKAGMSLTDPCIDISRTRNELMLVSKQHQEK